MKQTLKLSVPHQLTQAEARSRIAGGVADFRARYGQGFANVEEAWTGDHMDFKVGMMGQSIIGRIDVTPQAVNLEVDLPMILAALAERIRPQIQDQAKKLLEKK